MSLQSVMLCSTAAEVF